ncbi:shikimate dehydrogenase [Staphylococcus saccharolyticus]|uniref:Shikimate dehydrogenase (NADP(+)) n=1 Tax=Staphylococcus saccharolyticus TaxID=33028 RepID=A0A380H2L0_9STAP|nr:shikimate dehydrogenase [Staphylococcus saccharolyticus]MBL7565139.1 shikimate dehydrogenase [Staphylococcus saccharolyticus]MBL7571824.1 shikimate dehydrogenase [Staphylococcus saccharolyticus]QQB98310.1 shikimate dehydrogenase [Staphylococcus saccharolyticus]QRJ65836.1 shikimate dehydrogenase [Staphylococcus saccharolyticus]RTX96539.1 shikimate dehydrogenase [Staphylococcus saccharolyticus]
MKFAVIGNPISHSLSPLMHNANFKSLGINDTYEAINIPIEQFDTIKEIITEKNLDGFNITIPHKERILPFLDDINEQSKSVGAVNTVLIRDGKWIGYNTDGIGYVSGLNNIYEDLEETYILILGAGGASKGIANELSKIVKSKLTIANRTMSRFDNWQLDINKISLNEAEKHLDEFDIIINTTPTGMDNNECVISLDYLSSHALVSDIIYIPYKTPILMEAEKLGNPIHNGLDMFVYQGAESFKIWTGKQPNIHVMKETVINKLKGEI